MKLGRFRTGALVAAVGTLSWAGAAQATVRIQERAKYLGYPAQDCAYCHTFSIDHMREKARQLGISNLNCGMCHGNKLPKAGTDLLNDRGKWLAAERLKRKLPADAAWLKDYVEPSPRSSIGPSKR